MTWQKAVVIGGVWCALSVLTAAGWALLRRWEKKHPEARP